MSSVCLWRRIMNHMFRIWMLSVSGTFQIFSQHNTRECCKKSQPKLKIKIKSAIFMKYLCLITCQWHWFYYLLYIKRFSLSVSVIQYNSACLIIAFTERCNLVNALLQEDCNVMRKARDEENLVDFTSVISCNTDC